MITTHKQPYSRPSDYKVRKEPGSGEVLRESSKSYSKGFTTVELLVTLFIAAAFLMSGYQLYALVIKDGGEVRAQVSAGNAAYDYLQRYKPSATNPCTAQTPLTNSPITVPNISNVTITVVISCPFTATTSISKILITIQYGSPQQTLTDASYVTP